MHTALHTFTLFLVSGDDVPHPGSGLQDVLRPAQLGGAAAHPSVAVLGIPGRAGRSELYCRVLHWTAGAGLGGLGGPLLLPSLCSVVGCPASVV